ncbi:hypothetical protein MJN85_32805, partial [Salmonella enterica subsp. enterica serovar Anatum]|nr:hypothetical protein [Salmonella enterica subsp. enterica serovar Anatum]
VIDEKKIFTQVPRLRDARHFPSREIKDERLLFCGGVSFFPTVYYDKLIMATGSYPWIPPIKGSETQDCFVYRTIEDLNAIEA